MNTTKTGEVRLKEVAAEAGCSLTAVSQALRGVGKISAERREAIRRLAERLGYRRDGAAALLRGRRGGRGAASRGVALAYIERADTRLRVPGQMIEGLAEEAARSGYRLERFTYRTRRQLAGLLGRLAYRGVAGVFLGNLEDDGLAEELDWSAFVVIALWRFGETYPFHCARMDAFHALRQLAGLAQARGYRRVGIACLVHERRVFDDEDRLAAEQWVRARLGGLEPLLYRRDPVAEGLGEWLERWRPEAVIGFNTAVYHAITALGRRVPDDIAFAAIMCTEEEALRDGFCANVVNARMRAACVLELFEGLARRGEKGRAEFATETVLPFQLATGRTLPVRR